MITFNPELQHIVAKNPERAFMGIAPTLTTVSATYGEDVAASWLEIELDTLNDFAGVQNKTDMVEAAKIILIEHHFLKVSEIMLFIHRFKLGKYGHFYGSVDCLVITEALNKFLRERRDEINRYESDRKRRDMEKRLDSPTCITHEEYLKLKEARK